MITKKKVYGKLCRSFLKGDGICHGAWAVIFTSKEDMKAKMKELRQFVKENMTAADKAKGNASFDLYNATQDTIVDGINCSIRVMKLAQKRFKIM